MLTLSGKVLESSSQADSETLSRTLFSLTTNDALPAVIKKQKAYLYKGKGSLPDGYLHYVFIGSKIDSLPCECNFTVLPESFGYLEDGDVVAISKSSVRTLFRAASNHNSLLLTERCNHYCLMCSQPPKRHDDTWLLAEAYEAIKLLPRNSTSLGLTGGEPTTYGAEFVDLVRHITSWLPHTSLHILSNGRAFSDIDFARSYARASHQDVMLGIPIYSSDPARHDYIVQAEGAFDETIRGILNLKKLNQRVEIRVVIHKQSYEGLPALADFITRNLLFVDQVALMGLEMTGFTLANRNALWIDPADYQAQLKTAVATLDAFQIPVSIYNHQLCLLPQSLHRFNVKSISDWKNEFAPECSGCSRGHDCGGFFTSSISNQYSPSIRPFHE